MWFNVCLYWDLVSALTPATVASAGAKSTFVKGQVGKPFLAVLDQDYKAYLLRDMPKLPSTQNYLNILG